jgi:hypothetical protein
VDITPSPRILRMLGEIEFDEWQCIAELIDNAFDDFTDLWQSGASWPGGYQVSVTLPGPGASVVGSEVIVQDTGQGMSRERLEDAVRAGWSSNDRFDKLGLFGMGFNVSTARLGRRTRVLTTRAGDPEWIGVEIDFDTLGPDFQAKDITDLKSDPSEHGTRVEIGGLKTKHAEWLQRNAENLRGILGRVYSWILDSRPFELWVQGVRVKPRIACRWGDERYVVYGSGASSEKIPAYIEIDQMYDPADACDRCGNWQQPGKEVCDECGSTSLRHRDRRIHGWLGIQRHLDKREFGIDFLRNGRKILQHDQRLFQWSNPNDPLAGVDIEYPVELAIQGGRIIGEIHLDHVPVTYQKDAFEYGDRSWKAAVDFLRGPGPMLPQKAKDAGYGQNTSPLAQLVKGYRRNDPGLRNLIPGDGTRAIHEDTRAWARKFWQGDPDYQTDQHWWDAVLSHEQRKNKAKLEKATKGSTDSADENVVIEALGGTPIADGPAAPTTAPDEPPAKKETGQERVARYTAEAVVLPELSRDFGIPELGNLKITTLAVAAGPVIDVGEQPTPIWLVQGAGGTATALVDTGHQVFTEFGANISDVLLVEIAAVLKVRADSSLSHAQVAARLQAVCLPDTALDIDVISSQARELLADVRQRMADQVAADPQRALQHLTPDEQTATENDLVAHGAGLTANLGADGRFLLHVPPLFLVKLFEEWPEAFMDGRVFLGPYSTLTSPSSRRLSVARITGYLNDVATVLTFQTSPAVAQLQRTRLSIQLLLDELAPDE